MKKPLFKRVVTLLLALMMSFSGVSFNARTVRADSSSTWEKVTDIAAAAASGKQVAITMTTSDGTVIALPAATTSSAPAAITATKDSDNNLVIADGASAFGWTITESGGKYTITNADGKYLYITAANNGVRVNSKPDVGYEWTVSNNYLAAVDSKNATRYLGVYIKQDWRCYTSTTGNSNIANQTLEFWTLKSSDEQPEEIIAQLDKFTAVPENNSHVVIYYPADGLALTTTAVGAKLSGVAATIEDGKLNQTAKMAYLTVTKDSNGYYTFTSEDGKFLTSKSTGNGLSFEATAGDYSLWTLQQQADGTWYIINVNATYNNTQQAIEYWSGFTTYGLVENDSKYIYEFYGVQGETPPTVTHTVTVQQPEYGGTLAADKTEVADGESVVITATPDEYSALITILVNGVEHIDEVVDNKLTLTVTEDIVVKGYFGAKDEEIRTITVLPAEHGQVYTEFDKIDNDQDVNIYVEPDEGYELTNLYISYTDSEGNHQVDLTDPSYNNNGLLGPHDENGVTYYFFTVDWDITVQAVFAPVVLTHTVTVQQPAEGGTVSVDKTEVAHGETVVITTTPAEGYVLDKLLVNGVETAVDAEGKATVTVTADITVTAIFKVKPSDTPVTYASWELVTDINELQDGDCVIVVNVANNKALSTTYSGFYNIGEDVIIADNLVTNATETMQWTIGITTGTDGTKTYTFSTAEGKKLSMGASYSSMPLDDVNDTWAIETAPSVANAYFIKNIGRNLYIEWYASKGNWSGFADTSNEDLFAQAFYKGIPAKEGLVTDISALEDGDQVIIVNDANSKALSTTYSGFYNIGEDVTIVDDKVTNATETMVWTVGITTGTDGTKIYTFSTAEGKKLSMGASYSSMPLDDVNDTWAIEAAPTIANAYFIKNIGRNLYIEWYASKGNWSGFADTSNELLFAQKFYWYAKPQDQPAGDSFGLTSQLAAGDEVIIYNAAHSGGVGNSLAGYNVTAVPLTPEEGVITTPNTNVVWTVVVNDDGTYSFTQGDKVLGGVVSGNYKNLVVENAEYTKWTLDGPDPTDFNYYCYLGEMTYNGGHVYLEYYNGFSLYGETTPSKDNYGITFYKKGAEPETPNPAANGDLVTSLDQLTDGTTVAIYSPGHLTAISTKPNGDWYLRANPCTIEDGKVVNFTSDFVWKVQVNDDGTYTFLSNDDPTKSITVWPSGDYAEVTVDYEKYAESGDNTWNLAKAKTANCWYFSSPTIAHAEKGTAYLEAYVRNEWEVFSGYFTNTSSYNFTENNFALQFYLINPEDAVAATDDGEWDGVLNKGEAYVFYNIAAQGSVGLYKEANYAMDAIATEIRDGVAYAGNGAYVFKVDTMGKYYSFEINGKYLATNSAEEMLFVEKNDDGTLPEEAKWMLVPKSKDGVNGYIIYNKECRYNGTPVCIEYYSSVFSGWTFSTKNDVEIYMFQFYKLADGIEVRDDTVQIPSVVFDCEDSRCIEQDYLVAFSLDDLAADITSINISYITGTETKTVTDYTVSADKKAYSFFIPASEIDVESATDSFKIVVEVRNSYDIEYTGEKVVQILDEPFIEDLTPAPNAQTLDDKKPVISARVGNVGDNPTFVMTLNGEEVNAVYENGRLTYQAAEDMEDGLVMVYVKCTRADGVFAEKNWNFTVGKADFQLYFGQLHSHTTYSDGSGTLDTALDYIASLPKSANVQFVAFTDHSNYFDTTSAANPTAAMNDASLMPEASRALWNAYRNQITTFNSRQTDIVAIAGYEMTWSGGPGHINSFNTDGLVSRNNAELNNKAGDAGMKLYYQTMNNDNGESLHQFNHPGATFGNFTDFSYWDEETDAHIFLVEVGNGEGQIGAGGYYPSYEQYIIALDKGWHLGPTNNQDNHKGRWGNANDARDVVLTNDFSVEGIYEAIRNLRIYATEDKNLEIGYTVNDQQMGTIFNDNNPVGDKMNVVVRVFDPDNKDSIVKVELVSDGGVTSYTWNNAEEIASGMLTAEINPEYSYYFVRVTQADGDLAVTAPIWTRSAYKIGFESLKTSDESDKVYVNEPFNLEAKLYNQEEINAKVKSVTFTYNGNVVLGTVTQEQNLTAGSTVTIPLEGAVLTEAKKTTIRATAIVEVDGKTYTYTKDLDLKVVDRENENKITPIAEVRQASDPADTGYYFNIEGVVSSNASGYDRDTAFFDCIYVQDATGGICCFPVSGEYKVGDKVRITGYTDFYQGEPELQVETIKIIDELAIPYELEPTEITAEQLNNRSAEGKLVTIKGTVDSFEVVNELVQTIMVKDAAGDLARVFIDGYITTENEVRNLEIGAECEVTGLASYDDTFEGPFPRIRIRDRADVVIKPAEDELDLHVVEMNTTGIDLAWNDTGSTSYQLYRDGELIATTSEPSYHDAVGRTMGYAYTYSVKDGSDKEYNELVVIYNPFIDVEEGTPDFTYIAWAYNHAIVNGIEGFNNIFSPQGNCERMNFCIMLWKIYGKPNPGKKTPFKDLKGLSTNNVKAITWLYNKKIVAGYTKTTFKPHNNITRAQLAIMIWKMAGKPSVDGLECPYTDIEVTKTFTANNRKAVIWCYNYGLINSIEGDKFLPDQDGTRSLLTEMLYGYNKVMHIIND